jgi:hypothetical protein
VLLTVGLLPVLPPAWANEELHPGSRLFYPLWDVSSANRLTFIIVTREALNETQSIKSSITAGTGQKRFWIAGTGNCRPRGAGGIGGLNARYPGIATPGSPGATGTVTNPANAAGSGAKLGNINRTDLGGTSGTPVFVDDVHFEYYGKSCSSNDEVVHMSCADIDLFLLASNSNAFNKPRAAFIGVADEGRGALDVHFNVNGQTDPKQRKHENSLMGHAIISDLAEGWAATYPAAAAKSTTCFWCPRIDGGTPVGYENYPMEVFLPFALADPFPAPGGGLRNVLSLWGPGLFPGQNLNNTSINIDFKWWDGRERPFFGSVNEHILLRPLGGASIAGLDQPIDPIRFSVPNFVCGHDSAGTKAENDGFPRTGTNPSTCGTPDVPDTAHPSDNFENGPDSNDPGHTMQNSTSIGWWRFKLRRDGLAPNPFNTAHSGRGLVGVVLSSTPGAAGTGVGDATRLWHKDPCLISQSDDAFGPPHLLFPGDRSQLHASRLSLFNIYGLDAQKSFCNSSSPRTPGFAEPGEPSDTTIGEPDGLPTP